MGRRYVVVGAGIVGLATARRLLRARPGAEVVVVDKEPRVAVHQTGRNSGVLHAGVYYKPGSLKARLCTAGRAQMIAFCEEHGIPFEICGKLIAATGAEEVPRLEALFERSTANGLPVEMLGPEGSREVEPHVAAVAAMRVPVTGITDFGRVCRVLAELIAAEGGRVLLGTRVTGVTRTATETVVSTTAGDLSCDVLVNCAGLHADRVARMAGLRPPARIVPFRGEYFELRPDRVGLVRGLIYPVPDPRFPFLGVHLTRMIGGGVHAGPNAVLALAREGYGWGRIVPRDVAEAAAYPGLWRLAGKYWRYGLTEVRRSLSKRRFAASLARLVPELTVDDIVPSGAGVRAQAITPRGGLVDDFLIVDAPGQVHVLNAPSPAATSSLAIADHIVSAIPEE